MSEQAMLFAGNSHLEFARALKEYLGWPLFEPTHSDKRGRPQIKWFSNGNVFVDIKPVVQGAHCFFIQTQAHPDKVSDHFVEMLWMVRALKGAGASNVTVVMPKSMYDRSDQKDHAQCCVGFKLFVELLTAAGMTGYLTMEPHFAQIHGFFDENIVRVDTLRAKPIFARHIIENYDLKNLVVVAPDFNEAKHSGPIASLLGVECATIDKRRQGDDEEAKAFGIIGSVAGKDGILFDDECASGKTFLEAVETCFDVKKGGMLSMRALFAHLVLTSPKYLAAMQANDRIKEIVGLDTVPVPPEKKIPKLKILSTVKYFGEAIKLIHAGEKLDPYKESLYEGLKEMADRKRNSQ